MAIKDSTTPSKSGMAATLNKISSSTGLETVQLVGGSANLIKPGSVVSINKSTNTQYNSTSKLNTSANQKEILKNVEAVKNKGLNTVLIQAYSDSTGKSDYNLGLSQARANEDLKNYAVTMEKNGYSAKDGKWKDATGKVVPASKCTSFCSFTKNGETTPSIQLAAQGLGEVTKNTPGVLGKAQEKIVAAGCANIRTGKCGAMHDAQRVSLIGGVLDSTLIKTTTKATGCTVEPCVGPTLPPTPPPTPGPTCTVNCDGTPPPQCLNPLGCDPVKPRPTPTPTPTPSATPTPVDPTAVVDPRTTTSRLPSSGVVTGGSSTASGAPSSGSSTTGSTSTTAPSGTPSSGVTGTPGGAGSSSTGSTLLPPTVGLGGSTSGGTLGATPSTPTGGSASTATPAPKFKVS